MKKKLGLVKKKLTKNKKTRFWVKNQSDLVTLMFNF